VERCTNRIIAGVDIKIEMRIGYWVRQPCCADQIGLAALKCVSGILSLPHWRLIIFLVAKNERLENTLGDGSLRQKTTVIVKHSNESTQFACPGRLWKLVDRIHSFDCWGNAVCCNIMSQNCYISVVDIHCHKIEIAEDVVHVPLKLLRCIPESKCHHIKLEEPERCDDCGLFLILRREWNLMIDAGQIDGGEDLDATALTVWCPYSQVQSAISAILSVIATTSRKPLVNLSQDMAFKATSPMPPLASSRIRRSNKDGLLPRAPTT